MSISSKKISKGSAPRQSHVAYGDGQIFRGIVMWAIQDLNMVKIRTTSGGLYDAYVGQAFQGGASGITGMPDTGAVGIFAMTGENHPVALAWLPSSPQWSPKYQHVEVNKADAGQNAENFANIPYMGHKHRILQPGQISLYSKPGADLDLNDDATISNSMGNSFRLRSADQSANLTAPILRGAYSGVYEYKGIVIRNQISVLGAERMGVYSDTVENSDGSETTYIGGQFSPVKDMASEYRIEARGFAIPTYDPTQENQFFPGEDKLSPDVEFTLANNIGNDSTHPNYGKFLRPQVFAGPGVHGGQIIPAINSWRPVISTLDPTGENIRTEGTLWSVRVMGQHLKGYGSYIALDKHGVLHEHLGSSESNTQFGVSKETVGKGAKLEHWGSNSRGISWEAMHSGSVIITAGKGVAAPGSLAYSWRLNAVGKTFESHNFGALEGFNDYLTDLEDTNKVLSTTAQMGYGYIKKIGGHARTEIASGRYELLSNGYTLKSTSASLMLQGSFYVNTASSADIIATSRIALQTAQTLKMSASILTEVYNLGTTKKIISGGESNTILLGGRADVINGADTKLVNGASTCTVNGILSLISGSNIFTADMVSNSTSIASGGAISLTAGGSVSINAPSVSINAPSVVLGTGVLSPVLTLLTHPCLVVGLLPPPGISGSKVVMAAS